jgi:hypothetical protein
MGTGESFPGVKRQGREADHSPPTSAEIKKMWMYTSFYKSRRMRWARHVARIGEKRNAYRILVVRDHWEDQEVGG